LGFDRKYLMTCVWSQPTGNTASTGTTVFSLLNAFAGNSLFTTGATFSYNAIVLSGLSALSNVNYNQRAEDFISYVHGTKNVFGYTSAGINSLLANAEIENFVDCFDPPTTPLLIQTEVLNSTAPVSLSWIDNSVGEQQFDVQYDVNGDENWINAPSQPAAANITAHNFTLPASINHADDVRGRVRATYSGGSTVWATSHTLSITVDSVPAASTNVILSSLSTTETTANLKLIWDDNSFNETDFYIQYKLNNVGTPSTEWVAASPPTVPANSTAHTFTINIEQDDDVQARLIARGNAGDTYVTSNTLTDLDTIPAKPTNLTIVQQKGLATTSTIRLRINWTDNSDNETGFKLQYRVAGGSWTDVAAQPLANITSYNSEQITVNNGDLIEAQIRSYNDAGNSTYSPQVTSFNAALKPTDPTGFEATWLQDRQWMSLVWVDSNVETEYVIERKLTVQADIYYEPIATKGANTESHFDIEPPCDETYRYRIQARNVGGTGLVGTQSSNWVYADSVAAPCTIIGTTTSTSTTFVPVVRTGVFLRLEVTNSGFGGGGDTNRWRAIFGTSAGGQVLDVTAEVDDVLEFQSSKRSMYETSTVSISKLTEDGLLAIVVADNDVRVEAWHNGSKDDFWEVQAGDPIVIEHQFLSITDFNQLTIKVFEFANT
jgi:hypothetical protein